jgi:multidrug efflux system outer membrane protein
VQLRNLQAYRKAVLSAFADVEKALVALAQFALQERLQSEAVTTKLDSYHCQAGRAADIVEKVRPT